MQDREKEVQPVPTPREMQRSTVQRLIRPTETPQSDTSRLFDGVGPTWRTGVQSSATSRVRPMGSSPEHRFVAARDRSAETEADRIAATASSRLSASDSGRIARSIRVGGSRLPSQLQRVLHPLVGDTSKVTMHSDADSTAASASLGARAFAQQSRVHLGAGERSAPDATELVLHEAVHAVRHTSASGSAPVDAQGSELVHAKLKGTNAALKEMGGGSTSGTARKFIGKKTNWDQVTDGLAEFEKTEIAVVKTGVALTPKDKDRLISLIDRIETACLAWQKANSGDKEGLASEQRHKTEIDTRNDDGGKTNEEGEWIDPTDGRTKANRRQAIAMLLPRIRREREDLRSGQWEQQFGLNDSTMTHHKDRFAGGAMNTVDAVKYQSGGESFEGVFKEDKGFDKKPGRNALESGIRRRDPNYSARAVAMYRLDKLLQTDVIARTEFATHHGKVGSVSEMAKGTQASKLSENGNIALTDDEKRRKGDTAISVEDPVLQRCLNKLQVIDAISGQLDRHGGNFYIQTDASGKVTGVTGIDLDMAFGKDMDDPSFESKPRDAVHYRGIPALIDYELGQRLLQITDEDIEAAIGGLLDDDEVEATKLRFRAVREHAEELDKSQSLTRQWTSETAKQGRSALPTTNQSEFGDIDSYSNVMADLGAPKSKLQTPVADTIMSTFETVGKLLARPWGPKLNALADPQRYAIRNATRDAVTPVIVTAAFNARIGVDDAPGEALRTLDEVFADDQFWNQLIMALDNAPEQKVSGLFKIALTELNRRASALPPRRAPSRAPNKPLPPTPTKARTGPPNRPLPPTPTKARSGPQG